MENHPIPQDVTGFKFKLIGSVTVKQFLYLLGFGIFTTIVFILEVNLFIKIPLMLAFASFGVALAFVPIEGRPMDTMIINFVRAIPAENMYIYRKSGANLSSFEFFTMGSEKQVAQVVAKVTTPQDEKKAILLSRLRNSTFRPDQPETRALNAIHTYFADSSTATSAPPILGNPLITDQDSGAEELKKKRLDAIVKEAQEERAKEEAEKKQLEKQSQVQKPPLTNNAVEVKFSGEETSHKIPKESTPSPSRPERTNPTLAGGFPTLPDLPNIVLGIIRDPRGKTLQNILVEIMDTNGTPVRAFKTNALGQFASATPLANSKYKIYFEDPGKQHEFEPIEVNLTGDIFYPLEITSIDAREKLRQELFRHQATA